jgi:hypothetical protein
MEYIEFLRFLDKLDNKNLFLIWSIVVLGYVWPKYIIFPTSFQNEYGRVGTTIFLIPLFFLLFYYPAVHWLGYLYWKISKGFNGNSSLHEMQKLMVMAVVPFLLYLPVFLIFFIVGVINNNSEVIRYNYYSTSLILGFLRFRILVTGIAKLNNFGWQLSLAIWLIINLCLSGFFLFFNSFD